MNLICNICKKPMKQGQMMCEHCDSTFSQVELMEVNQDEIDTIFRESSSNGFIMPSDVSNVNADGSWCVNSPLDSNFDHLTFDDM